MRFFRVILIVCCALLAFSGSAQTAPAQDSVYTIIQWPFLKTVRLVDSLKRLGPVTYWKGKNKFGLNINEVAFKNWNAGGTNSVSLLLSSHIERTYAHKNIRWKNEILTRYGINSQDGQKLKKTNDHFEINSTFGYRADTSSNWFYSAKFNFKSQFSPGYNYPDRTKFISNFMAPGYMFVGFGTEYGKDSDVFTLYLSPATAKTTFVLNQRLANKGAFGVDPAILDDDGNIIKEGKKIKSEFGILLTNEYNVELMEDVKFTNRLNLYTDYLNDFGNIDVDWDVRFKFKVNKYILASLGYHLLYDNDTKTMTTNDAGEEITRGAKVQWKQQLGIGVILNI